MKTRLTIRPNRTSHVYDHIDSFFLYPQEGGRSGEKI